MLFACSIRVVFFLYVGFIVVDDFIQRIYGGSG